jgi:hypothetical protein
MNLNTNPLVLAADIPKLDLSRNIENIENLEKLVKEFDINQFKNLQELFENIFQSIENNLKFFFFLLFNFFSRIGTLMIQSYEKFSFITFLAGYAKLNIMILSCLSSFIL